MSIIPGILSSTGSSSSGIALAMTASTGGTSPYTNVYKRGTDGITFGTIVATHTGITGADSFTDSSAVAGTAYYYEVLITDSALNTATSNIYGPVTEFATYSAAPANPQIDLSGALATTLQSYVLFKDGLGSPRNVVNNALPYRFAGVNYINCGDDPLWIANDFTPNTTPTPSLRFATNSRTQAYSFGGVGVSSVRTGNPTSRTYFGIFQAEAADSNQYTYNFPIITACQSVYNQSYSSLNPLPSEGLGVTQFGPSGYLSYYANNLGAIICTDITGTIHQCPITPGHWYFGFVSVSDSYSPNSDGQTYCRFGLYDLTEGFEVSPQGNQYTTVYDGSNLSSANSKQGYGALFNLPSGYDACDLLIHGDAGLTSRVVVAGIDNAYWGNGDGIGPSAPAGIPYSIFHSFIANPYFPLTSTVNTSGSPPTSLILTDDSGSAGSTLIVPASEVSGVPANLPNIYIGDFNVTALNNINSVLQATPPVGAPHAIASYRWYYSTAYESLGTLLATTSVPVYTFTPPDGNLYYVTCTATDTQGTVYTYQQLQLALRVRQSVKIMLAGNSVFTFDAPFALFQVMCAICVSRGFDLCLQPLAIPGTAIQDYDTGSATVSNYFGLGGGSINPLNWMLIRAAAEKNTTGRGYDMIGWQLAGNNASVTQLQYLTLANDCLTGTGVDGTRYTPAIGCVNFAQAIWQFRGHDYGSSYEAQLSQANAAAIANGTTIIVTGKGPAIFSQVYPYQMALGHPDPIVEQVMAYSLINEFPPIAPQGNSTGGNSAYS